MLVGRLTVDNPELLRTDRTGEDVSCVNFSDYTRFLSDTPTRQMFLMGFFQGRLGQILKNLRAFLLRDLTKGSKLAFCQFLRFYDTCRKFASSLESLDMEGNPILAFT